MLKAEWKKSNTQINVDNVCVRVARHLILFLLLYHAPVQHEPCVCACVKPLRNSTSKSMLSQQKISLGFSIGCAYNLFAFHICTRRVNATSTARHQPTKPLVSRLWMRKSFKWIIWMHFKRNSFRSLSRARQIWFYFPDAVCQSNNFSCKDRSVAWPVASAKTALQKCSFIQVQLNHHISHSILYYSYLLCIFISLIFALMSTPLKSCVWYVLVCSLSHSDCAPVECCIIRKFDNQKW